MKLNNHTFIKEGLNFGGLNSISSNREEISSQISYILRKNSSNNLLSIRLDDIKIKKTRN